MESLRMSFAKIFGAGSAPNERLSLCAVSSVTNDQPSVLVQTMVFFGLILLSTGGWCCSQVDDPFPYESPYLLYRLPSRTMMFEGSMLLALGTVTICAASAMPRLLLIMLTQSLYPVFLLEAIAGGSSMALISTVWAGSWERSLRQDMAEYGPHTRVTVGMDRLQRTRGCCGAAGPRDWGGLWEPPPNSDVMLLNETSTTWVPASCCGLEDGACRLEDINGTVKGCAETLSPHLEHHFYSVIYCAFVCLALHHSLFMAAMYLDRNI